MAVTKILHTLAMAAPIPDEAPVTQKVFPFKGNEADMIKLSNTAVRNNKMCNVFVMAKQIQPEQ
jgi:hypothetical protein